MSGPFSYDTLPYPSYTFAQTHPDRLATMATYHGVAAADPQNCRLLELGCGTGANLAAMAYSLPSSEFVGIDLSRVHIDEAMRMQMDVGLRNTTFLKRDVMDFDAGAFGTFDYIVAHGLFSWVPEPARARVLEVYSNCLSENGVGYISFNAYPGCHIRDLTSSMMRYHVAAEADPLGRVRQAVEFISELSDAVDANGVYKPILKAELAAIRERSNSNIHHDDLADFNRAFFFHEFAELLRENGMQYLAESTPFASNTQKFSKAAQAMIERYAGGDVVRREQYIDFVKGTRFRSSLLCRESVSVNRNASPKIMKEFYIASDVKPQSAAGDASVNDTQRYVGSGGASFELNHPLTIAALNYLSAIVPLSLTLEELIEDLPHGPSDGRPSEDVASGSAEIGRLSAYLLQLFDAGFVKLHKFRPTVAARAGDRPRASRLARWQIANGGNTVTTLFGTSLAADDRIFREILSALDGTRDRAALATVILERVEVAPEEKEKFKRELPGLIDEGLDRFAALGLLIN